MRKPAKCLEYILLGDGVNTAARLESISSSGGICPSIYGDATEYGTHSMRRAKATLIYRRTGNLRAVQLLLGHTRLESTVRYPGVEVDDALELAEQTEV